MVLNHIAAILLFSGPLFYLGLFLAVLPADAARLAAAIARPFTPGFEPVGVPGRARTALRLAGIALLLLAIAA